MPFKNKLLLRALAGQTTARPPFWLMRQAGRYLPEYRKLRAETGSFLELCLTPEAAVEATLQPIRRYGMDAAILFSDILMVPHGLGQEVVFEEGQGPVLAALADGAAVARLRLDDGFHERLAPVYRTVRELSQALPEEVALIGFAGAPWTVASYMVEGGSSRDFAKAKAWAYGDPDSFQRLIDLLVEATTAYLLRQVEAGAEALQLFDSWAGVLAEPALRRWCLEPAREIVRRMKAAAPHVPVILFPRGAGVLYEAFAGLGAAGLSLDTTVPAGWAAEKLQPQLAVQGNLDPMVVVTGGEAMSEETRRILAALGRGPFIFNLGHGIVPQTPPEHVAQLAELVRGWTN